MTAKLNTGGGDKVIFGEDYKRRLKEYCQQRIKEENNSIRQWTYKLGVDKTTVNPWIKGTLIEPIRLNTLEALARDRSIRFGVYETPEDTRDWLEGKPTLLERVHSLPPHAQARLLADLMYKQYQSLQAQFKNGGVHPLVVAAHSCTLSTSVSVHKESEGDNVTTNFELIEVGSPRHLKLKAILVATLRLKKIPLENLEEEDLEAIADLMGYNRAEPLRFNAGLEMLEGFLKTDEDTFDAVGDYHLVYLANFCHRLKKYYEFPAFHAVCDESLTYEGDVEQLLSDVTRNGALIG